MNNAQRNSGIMNQQFSRTFTNLIIVILIERPLRRPGRKLEDNFQLDLSEIVLRVGDGKGQRSLQRAGFRLAALYLRVTLRVNNNNNLAPFANRKEPFSGKQ